MKKRHIDFILSIVIIIPCVASLLGLMYILHKDKSGEEKHTEIYEIGPGPVVTSNGNVMDNVIVTKAQDGSICIKIKN